MTATPEHYAPVLDALPDAESLTVLVVAGASREQVAQALDIDLTEPVDEPEEGGDDFTGWALLEVPGGVLAIEPTGYGDPTLAALRELSADGRAAAVARGNVQAHVRFGCARDGEVLFDDDEFIYVEDPAAVPAELRSLFDLVWDDLEDEDDEDDDAPDAFAVGLAMAEIVTGVAFTEEHAAAVAEAAYFRAPTLVYASPAD